MSEAKINLLKHTFSCDQTLSKHISELILRISETNDANELSKLHGIEQLVLEQIILICHPKIEYFVNKTVTEKWIHTVKIYQPLVERGLAISSPHVIDYMQYHKSIK